MDPIKNQNDSGRQIEQAPAAKPVQENGLSLQAGELLQKEWAMKQQFQKIEEKSTGAPGVVSLAKEAGYSAVYTGVQSPAIGLSQLVSKDLAKSVEVIPPPTPADFGTAKWHAQVVGDAAGMLLPFLATRGAMKQAGMSLVAKEEAMVAAGRLARVSNSAVIADSALTGFVYDFTTRPVNMEKDNFWTDRAKNGLSGAMTFGVMGATSTGLRSSSREMVKNLSTAQKAVYNASIGAVSGVPAGLVSAESTAMLNEGRFATNKELVEGAYGMSVAGGSLGLLHPVLESKKSGGAANETASGSADTERLVNSGIPINEKTRSAVIARQIADSKIPSVQTRAKTYAGPLDPALVEELKRAPRGDLGDSKPPTHDKAPSAMDLNSKPPEIRGSENRTPGPDSQTIIVDDTPEGRAKVQSMVEDFLNRTSTESDAKSKVAPVTDLSTTESEGTKSAESVVEERPEAFEMPRAIDPQETVSMRELVERGDPRVDELMKEYYPKLERAFPLEGEIESTDTYKEYLSDPEGTWDMVLLRDAEQKIIGGIQFQVIDAQGEMLNKVAWVEHIWVEEENRTFPNFKNLLKIAADRTKAAGADLVFMEFNNPDKMTLEQMAEDAEGGITTQDRETLWGSVGIHVAVDAKGNIAEYGQPSMDGQPSVEYLSLGFIGNEALTGQKLPIADYLALARAAHSTIPGCDLATDPTVVNYTKACMQCEGNTFTLKPLADIAKVRRAEAKLKESKKNQ